jgi:hypothetical protein
MKKVKLVRAKKKKMLKAKMSLRAKDFQKKRRRKN